MCVVMCFVFFFVVNLMKMFLWKFLLVVCCCRWIDLIWLMSSKKVRIEFIVACFENGFVKMYCLLSLIIIVWWYWSMFLFVEKLGFFLLIVKDFFFICVLFLYVFTMFDCESVSVIFGIIVEKLLYLLYGVSNFCIFWNCVIVVNFIVLLCFLCFDLIILWSR